MPQTQRCSMTTSGFVADHERHLADFYGFTFNSRRLHLYVIRSFLDIRFPSARINWHALQFSDLAELLKREFRRLPNASTQRVWLAAMRRFVRHLASEGLIPNGWQDVGSARSHTQPTRARRVAALEDSWATTSEPGQHLWNVWRSMISFERRRLRMPSSAMWSPIFSRTALISGAWPRAKLFRGAAAFSYRCSRSRPQEQPPRAALKRRYHRSPRPTVAKVERSRSGCAALRR